MCIINGKFWTYLVFYETWVNRPCLICKQKIVTFFKYSLCNALNVVLYHEFGPGYLQDGLGRRDVWFTSALALRVGSQLDFSMWTELNASGFRWRMSASLIFCCRIVCMGLCSLWWDTYVPAVWWYFDKLITNWTWIRAKRITRLLCDLCRNSNCQCFLYNLTNHKYYAFDFIWRIFYVK